MAIKARKITAKNVGDLQIHGADTETAAELAGIKTHSDVIAEEIEAENLAGVQIFGPSGIDTVDRLRTELAALRQELVQATVANSTDETKEALATLESAAQQLDQPKPSADMVLPRLKKVTEILDTGTRMTESADKLGKSMSKLVPIAHGIYQAAVNLLGA